MSKEFLWLSSIGGGAAFLKMTSGAVGVALVECHCWTKAMVARAPVRFCTFSTSGM